MKKEKFMRCCCLLLLSCMAAVGCAKEEGLELKEDPSREVDILETTDKSLDTKEVLPEMIKVYICGKVHQPGVYELPNTARLTDAVNAAGGMTEEADPSCVNLAQYLEDGQMICIRAVGEQQAATSDGERSLTDGGQAESGKVNINTADTEKLMQIPGIGSAKAAAIIRYREEQGAFQKIEDIMNIEGIKDGVFQKIKEYICTK